MTQKIVDAHARNAKRIEQRRGRLKQHLDALYLEIDRRLRPFHKKPSRDAFADRVALLNTLLAFSILDFDKENADDRIRIALEFVHPGSGWWRGGGEDDPHVTVHRALGVLRTYVSRSRSPSRFSLEDMLEGYEAQVLRELEAKRRLDAMIAKDRARHASGAKGSGPNAAMVIDFATERAARGVR